MVSEASPQQQRLQPQQQQAQTKLAEMIGHNSMDEGGLGQSVDTRQRCASSSSGADTISAANRQSPALPYRRYLKPPHSRVETPHRCRRAKFASQRLAKTGGGSSGTTLQTGAPASGEATIVQPHLSPARSA